jgi:hypothetical protein
METEKKLVKKEYKGKTYFYDQNKYNKTFYEKHKNDVNAKITCECCGGTYSYYNKTKHIKSKKHIFHVERQEQQRQQRIQQIKEIEKFIISHQFESIEE